MDNVFIDTALLTDVGFFVLAVVASYALRLAQRWVSERTKEGDLSRIERLAVEAVRYAEILDAQGRLTEFGVDKKSKAVEALEIRLKRIGIKADMDELDQAIENAWYREFANK